MDLNEFAEPNMFVAIVLFVGACCIPIVGIKIDDARSKCQSELAGRASMILALCLVAIIILYFVPAEWEYKNNFCTQFENNYGITIPKGTSAVSAYSLLKHKDGNDYVSEPFDENINGELCQCKVSIKDNQLTLFVNQNDSGNWEEVQKND
jgi:hypothetical protein